MNQDLIKQDFLNRERALDPSHSFIIQAPAGSGKTELLIQRFLVLLSGVNKPEEILAITFTKKAANEMRARIVKALKFAMEYDEPKATHEKKTWQLATNVLKRDKEFGWHLTQNPNQLRILTIDAFCAFLTKQLPLLSQFGSQPEVSQNSEALYREAVMDVLSHIESETEWSLAIEYMLLHLDNDLNKLSDLLVNLLAKRDQWIHYIQFDTKANQIRNQLEKQLQLIISDRLKTLSGLFPTSLIPELIAIARFAASNVAHDEQQSLPIYACQSLTSLPGDEAEVKAAWLGLGSLLLTKRFTWRKRVDADIGFPSLTSLKNPEERLLHNGHRIRLNELIKLLEPNEALRLAFTNLFTLPEPTYTDEQWQTLSALFQVLKIVSAQLRLTFQRHGKIDFIENSQAALAALGEAENPTDLALALDYQIKHILIDEFQDTSFTQYQLLEKLTAGWDGIDGRTLFIVGDPMQSIYRFREAEVGLFIRMQTLGIGQIQLIPLTLAVNFRSSATIVDWNNDYFHKIFPTQNDIANGSVTFHQSIAFHANNAADQSISSVNVNGYLAGDEHPQSSDIATTVLSILEKHPDESIAILVRSRSHLAQVIPALKRNKIPYRAVDIDPLAEGQIIQDLLSLTCALNHPADRLAWLSLLRSPFSGLTLADLLIIAGNNASVTIWEQLQNETIFSALSNDGQVRVKRISKILTVKLAEKDRSSLRAWVESTWVLLGGPACLAEYHDIHDVNAYFNLLDDYTNDQAGFDPIKLKHKINRLFASAKTEECALQIMTIHTAKGLEFDHVILPHLERKMPHDDKALLLWMEQPLMNEHVALLLAPIHATGKENGTVYSYIQRQMKLKSDFEVDRLFYVAATRAKKHLYLYFTIKQKTEGDYQLESGSFLAKFWPVLAHKEKYIPSSHHHLVHHQGRKKQKRPITRLTLDWRYPLGNTMVKQSALHYKKSGFLLADYLPRLVGIVIHLILQKLANHGIAWWQKTPLQQQTDYLRYQLRQVGVLPQDLGIALNLTQKAIQNTLSDSKGQWILASHPEAKSEFAISAILNNKIESLVIDRTFIDENNVRWIIDYKTATLTHADIDRFIREEEVKYREKMATYSEAMRFLDDRPIRLGLYFPSLPAWHVLE
ncbi:MAG: hypothetical protein A3F14_01450 [Gammaproteobacteria bacterium RIFCSPHIGHO2_12_FULL_43_28]|nr:MAG: hypothetical protein A3F14_01450 [Gammaproteobacteria bacterium RIFCSPHIGHO2_12_FULL_43_28]